MSDEAGTQDAPSAQRDPGRLSEQELWSWVDRDAPELDEYVARHPDEARRVAELRAAIGRLVEPAAERPVHADGFEVLGILGRGGMGAVYEARQEDPRRVVALKVLPFDVAADERRLRLFRREADALARLSHPGIATVFEVGRCDDGRPYIAMERVPGVPLDQYVRAAAPGRRARVVLARNVCEAVGHAHEEGVVHRDLKPANVLVDARGGPKVVDFGLARIAGEEPAAATLATREGSLLGTLAYMSPEQARGRAGEYGPTGDVYQLGVLLCELFTGELPYRLDGLSLPEAARRICEVPPRLRGQRLRGDLRTIVLKALEKDPRRRFESAGELAADLARTLDGRPIEAARPAPAVRVWRFYRRHWLGTTAAALFLVLLATLVLPVRLPIPLLPDWWSEGAPFEDVRWVADTPEVQVDGRWYGLLKIDGLRSAYVVGFCQQYADELWRKRFSEDLVQVLNRMGDWTWRSVELTLRDLESGEVVVMSGVPLRSAARRTIQAGRHAWPWGRAQHGDAGLEVRFRGRDWRLVSIDGVVLEDVRGSLSLYDLVCDRAGRSPGERIDLVLRDPATGELRSFPGVERRRFLPKSR